MRIIYLVDNNLGGITSLNLNLINNPPPTRVEQWVINIDYRESKLAKSNAPFHADKEIKFHYSDKENLYATIRRLYKLLPKEEGALILNNVLEMQMLDHFHCPLTTYQLVHDDYNYKLACQYHHIVDVFIAHSKFFYDKLIAKFPELAPRIFYLPHGVNIPVDFRKADLAQRPIKLFFLGRMSSAKGIFDLPVISKLLDNKGVMYEWTCIGNGPELQQLKDRWQSTAPVKFLSPADNREVLTIAVEQDVFVLPTKFEGSPVSLLETMSVGLVPVITDLPGGIQELVREEIGFRIQIDNNNGFADAIEQLHLDRELLNRLSSNSRNKINAAFNVRDTAAEYHACFANYKKYYRPKSIKKMKIGARLDHPFLPSFLTKAIRSIKE